MIKLPTPVLACTLVCSLSLSALADDLVLGATDPNETLEIATDTRIDGTVVLVNNATLRVLPGATLTITDDIRAADTATVDIAGGTLAFEQRFHYDADVLMIGSSRLIATNATIDPGDFSFSIGLIDDAAASYAGVTLPRGFCTWALLDNASATLDDVTNAGEFVLFGSIDLSIARSSTVLLWITLFDQTVVDLDLPAPGSIASFTLDNTTPGVQNLPYHADLTDCTGVLWAVMARSGSTGTFRNSDLRVVGSYFERDNTITITGIANQATLADRAFAWGDVALHLINSTVQTWNFYPYGSTDLTLQSSIFGELLAGESANAQILGSLCDGSGGYIGTEGTAVLVLGQTTNLSQTIARSSSTLIVDRSALLGPDVFALENSVIALSNTPTAADPVADQSALVFDLAVAPVQSRTHARVDLLGSARVIAGPESGVSFGSYRVEVGPGTNPTSWTPITTDQTTPVRNATVATWAPTPAQSGLYSLRLVLDAAPAGSVSVPVAAVAQLDPQPCPADFSGSPDPADPAFGIADSLVDAADFFYFIDRFEQGDLANADLTGSTDPNDLSYSVPDGTTDANDFFYYLDLFARGCP